MDLNIDLPGTAMWADGLGEDIVSIIVGPKRKLFCVHKSLLRNGGDCFDVDRFGTKRIKKIKTNQAGRKSITLIGFSPQAVSFLITWLYRKQLPNNLETREHLEALFELYYLAEMQQDKELMDTTMDRIQDVSKLHGGFMTVEYVQDVRRKSPSPDSQLKKFAVYLFTYTFLRKCDRLQSWINIEVSQQTEQERAEAITHSGENIKNTSESTVEGQGSSATKDNQADEMVIIDLANLESQNPNEKEPNYVDLEGEEPDTLLQNGESSRADNNKVIITNTTTKENAIVNGTPVVNLAQSSAVGAVKTEGALVNGKVNGVATKSKAKRAQDHLEKLWASLYEDPKLLQEVIICQAQQGFMEDPRIRNDRSPEDKHYFHEHVVGEPCFADGN